MRKISEILYKKFRPAVFIKWGLGRNSTSSALTRLARKTYLAYKKDFNWPAPESLIRIRALSLSLTSIWCEIYVQGDCVKIYVFSSVRSSYSHPDLLLIHHHPPPAFSDHTGPQHWTFTF